MRDATETAVVERPADGDSKKDRPHSSLWEGTTPPVLLYAAACIGLLLVVSVLAAGWAAGFVCLRKMQMDLEAESIENEIDDRKKIGAITGTCQLMIDGFSHGFPLISYARFADPNVRWRRIGFVVLAIMYALDLTFTFFSFYAVPNARSTILPVIGYIIFIIQYVASSAMVGISRNSVKLAFFVALPIITIVILLLVFSLVLFPLYQNTDDMTKMLLRLFFYPPVWQGVGLSARLFMRSVYDATKRSSNTSIVAIQNNEKATSDNSASNASIGSVQPPQPRSVWVRVEILVQRDSSASIVKERGSSFCISASGVLVFVYSFFVYVTTLQIKNPAMCAGTLAIALLVQKTYRGLLWNRSKSETYQKVSNWLQTKFLGTDEHRETPPSGIRWRIVTAFYEFCDSPNTGEDLFYAANITSCFVFEAASLAAVYFTALFCEMTDIQECRTFVHGDTLSTNLVLAVCFLAIGFACDLVLMVISRIPFGEFFVYRWVVVLEAAFCAILATSYSGLRILSMLNPNIDYN